MKWGPHTKDSQACSLDVCQCWYLLEARVHFLHPIRNQNHLIISLKSSKYVLFIIIWRKKGVAISMSHIRWNGLISLTNKKILIQNFHFPNCNFLLISFLPSALVLAPPPMLKNPYPTPWHPFLQAQVCLKGVLVVAGYEMSSWGEAKTRWPTYHCEVVLGPRG